MQLNQRLKRLEQRVAPPAEQSCGVCGLPLPGAPQTGPAELVVGWAAPGDLEEPPCSSCGQRRVIRIEFDRAG